MVKRTGNRAASLVQRSFGCSKYPLCNTTIISLQLQSLRKRKRHGSRPRRHSQPMLLCLRRATINGFGMTLVILRTGSLPQYGWHTHWPYSSQISSKRKESCQHVKTFSKIQHRRRSQGDVRPVPLTPRIIARSSNRRSKFKLAQHFNNERIAPDNIAL